MKKINKRNDDPDMRSEYDFTGKKCVRGKYYEAYQKGHTVRIHKDDGSIKTCYFTPKYEKVTIEPDIRKFFPTSDSVNKALRFLISLIPNKPVVHRLNSRT